MRRRWCPGHGPVTDAGRNPRSAGYLVHVAEQAEAAYRKGLSFVEAADTIDLGEYANWLDAERVVINVYTRYRELDSEHTAIARDGIAGDAGRMVGQAFVGLATGRPDETDRRGRAALGVVFQRCQPGRGEQITQDRSVGIPPVLSQVGRHVGVLAGIRQVGNV